MKKKETVGILGKGEIGSAVARLCKEAGYRVIIRELNYDQLVGKTVDYLHVNIPEKDNSKFVNIVVKTIKEVKPHLTVINSSVTPGTTRKIFNLTKNPIVHSPVIGVHPYLYDSIKKHFPKIIGPVNTESLMLAKNHFRKLGLKIEVYDNAKNSEAAKLLDLVYFAWNIVFCKWMNEISNKLGLNFDQIYNVHNKIYNGGYKKLRPNTVRPILKPMPGPFGGHCTYEDTLLFEKFYKNRLTEFILKENERYKKEV